MTGPQYARGTKAWGLCKRCGLRFLLNELVLDEHMPGLRVCQSCFDTKQPQERPISVSDPQALWKPSPDAYGSIDATGITIAIDASAVGSLSLSWNSATFNAQATAGYRLYRSTDNVSFVLLADNENAIDAATFLLAETLEYVDTALVDLQTYYYYVVAYDAVGDTAQSNVVSATARMAEHDIIEFPFTYDSSYRPGYFSDFASISTTMLADTDGLVVEAAGSFAATVNGSNFFAAGAQFGFHARAWFTEHNALAGNLLAIVALRNAAGTRSPAWIAGGADTAFNNYGRVSFRQHDGASDAVRKRLNRSEWKYQFRRHDSPLNGQTDVLVQSVCFNPFNGKLLYSVHANETLTKVYEVDAGTGSVLRSFTTLAYPHFSSIRFDSVTGFWYAIGFQFGGISTLIRLDLEASLASGNLVAIWTATLRNQAGSMEFFTHAGTRYVAIAVYSGSSASTTRIYPASVLVSGWDENSASPTKTFSNSGSTQGLKFYNGYLYESSNGVGAAREGHIYKLDILTHMTSGTSGASYATFLTDTFQAPSAYPEELDFDETGRCWCGSESDLTFLDDVGPFSGIWSSALSHDAEANNYVINYDGAGTYTIYLNGQLFDTVSKTSGDDFKSLVIGTEPAGAARGYWGGVANVHIVRNGTIDISDAATLGVDSRALTSFPLSITNPGAESGTTGWTNESGAMSVFSTSPAPRTGAGYFGGGTGAVAQGRQRLDLVAQSGLSVAQMDASASRIIVTWYQASFNYAINDDFGMMGLRTLNAAQSQLTQKLPASSIVFPSLTWKKRKVAIARDALTQYVDLLYRADRNGGTNNNGDVDDISAAYVRQAP